MVMGFTHVKASGASLVKLLKYIIKDLTAPLRSALLTTKQKAAKHGNRNPRKQKVFSIVFVPPRLPSL